MSLPKREYDHYPYERCTPETVADIQRMRDRQMTDLLRENDELRHKLWRYELVEQLLKEAGIDLDVLLATNEILGD